MPWRKKKNLSSLWTMEAIRLGGMKPGPTTLTPPKSHDHLFDHRKQQMQKIDLYDYRSFTEKGPRARQHSPQKSQTSTAMDSIALQFLQPKLESVYICVLCFVSSVPSLLYLFFFPMRLAYLQGGQREKERKTEREREKE